ncbi:MAG: tryptophan--tRNA ligase [Candidatus Omnitrophota bacterium]|nr:tryptophan--tRNA ligase [Candidatus Omnitrophota bacterium]
MKKRILSGMRPTGPLHIGHLAGALKNWVTLQDEHECYFMIADWHALMSEYEDPRLIKKYTFDMMLDWLSCGIDPDKNVLFVQSHVPAHLELAMIFSLFVPLGRLERNPTYKEQLREIKGRNLTTYAFLGYPVLQSADISAYKANLVPVGADQLPHLELTREILRRFNSLYGKKIFPEPEALLTGTPKLLGTDNKKMSKSYGNFIAINENPDNIRKKVQKMITDPKRIRLADKGHPSKCNVFSYYKVFAGDETVKEAEQWCKNALRGCTECKKKMAGILIEYLSPIREKRKYLEEKMSERVVEPWAACFEKARAAAEATVSEVKDILHLAPVPRPPYGE